jgi:hypothetical protein
LILPCRSGLLLEDHLYLFGAGSPGMEDFSMGI